MCPRGFGTAWPITSARPAKTIDGQLARLVCLRSARISQSASTSGISSHVDGPDLTSDAPGSLIMDAGSIASESTDPSAVAQSKGLYHLSEEGVKLADHTPYQRKIIERYYRNFDSIQFQRLSELATDLYLAEGKKRDRLWTRVEESLRKLEFPEPRVAILMQKRDPALLVEVLKELERGSEA
jgi:hypothetical protein